MVFKMLLVVMCFVVLMVDSWLYSQNRFQVAFRVINYMSKIYNYVHCHCPLLLLLLFLFTIGGLSWVFTRVPMV